MRLLLLLLPDSSVLFVLPHRAAHDFSSLHFIIYIFFFFHQLNYILYVIFSLKISAGQNIW